MLAWRHSDPSAATGTTAELATTWPARKFTFDARGGAVPQAYAVTKPLAPEPPAAVRFTIAARAPGGAAATAMSVTAPADWRVSSARWGDWGTSPAPMENQPSTSITASALWMPE